MGINVEDIRKLFFDFLKYFRWSRGLLRRSGGVESFEHDKIILDRILGDEDFPKYLFDDYRGGHGLNDIDNPSFDRKILSDLNTLLWSPSWQSINNTFVLTRNQKLKTNFLIQIRSLRDTISGLSEIGRAERMIVLPCDINSQGDGDIRGNNMLELSKSAERAFHAYKKLVDSVFEIDY